MIISLKNVRIQTDRYEKIFDKVARGNFTTTVQKYIRQITVGSDLGWCLSTILFLNSSGRKQKLS